MAEPGVKALEEPLSSTEPTFNCPVDSECKRKNVWPIWSFAQPHMMAFHVSWIAFFVTFWATFAPAALAPEIRDNMNFTKSQMNNAGIAAVCGAVCARILMGTFLDTLGPRYGVASICAVIAPCVFCMSLVSNFAGFVVLRLLIGTSLCMFVACQYWVGTMFSVNIVGTANAIAAGWGNMGGGATNLLMPIFYAGIKSYTYPYEAWRWTFFIPGGAYVLMAIIALLFTQDAPLGDYRDLKKHGHMAKGQAGRVIWVAVRNYRTWICALCYGYSFGVELTVDNIIVSYFYDQFGLSLSTAGVLGGIFGLMNIFSRASGGMLSDVAAIYWGMRGRLWCLWIIQTLGGVFCLAMGYVDYSLGATVAVMIIFSIFCQQACGAMYGVVPFVSRRAYGVVAGIVGGGGNTGAAITQALWFGTAYSWQATLTNQLGFRWMGVMIIGITLTLTLIHFPMWGGMFTWANDDVTEEDYYIKEWTAEEVAVGLHTGSMRFAMESRSQRVSSKRGFSDLPYSASMKNSMGGASQRSASGSEVNMVVKPPSDAPEPAIKV